MPVLAALSRQSTGAWLSYACIATFIVVGVRRVRLWYRLRHIPGPRSAGWSLWWQLDGALSGKYHERLKAVADEYGKCMYSLLIQPRQVIGTDRYLQDHLYESDQANYYAPTPTYSDSCLPPAANTRKEHFMTVAELFLVSIMWSRCATKSSTKRCALKWRQQYVSFTNMRRFLSFADLNALRK